MSTHSIDYETDDLTRKVSDKAQAASAAAQDRIGRAADYVSDKAVKAGAQAKDFYGEVAGRARKVADQVDPYVKNRPYATMGVMVAAGLLVGLLMAGRGPKVIYVEPRD